MAGRKRAVPKVIVHNIFKAMKDELIDERNRVVKPSSAVFISIQNDERINRAMTTKAIYSEALKWWNDFIDKSKDASSSGISDASFPSIEADPISTNSSSVSSITPDNRSDFTFTLTLSSEVWETIQPIPKDYKRNPDKCHKTKSRLYYVLEPGVWTNILVDRIASHRLNIICTWSFKRAKVYLNGERFINVYATCTTCKAQLIGGVAKMPNEGENVKFTFIVQQFKQQKHNEGRKNVRTGGSKSKELFISSEKASVLKRKMVKESGSKMFEHAKGREVSENAIRAGQWRQRQSKKLSPLPLQALEYLKVTKLFGPSIHMSGLNPFFVIYASPNQFMLYNTYKKQNVYTKITCDSTGGLVNKLGNVYFISCAKTKYNVNHLIFSQSAQMVQFPVIFLCMLW